MRVLTVAVSGLAAVATMAGCVGGGSDIGDWSLSSGSERSDLPENGSDSGSAEDEPVAPSTSGETKVASADVDVTPAAIEELSPVLLAPSDVGVPDTWALLDLDPLVPSELLDETDAALLRGVGMCADGTRLLPRPTDRPWISRRFSNPDEPIDDGLLQVEILAEQASGDGSTSGDPSLGLEEELARWDDCELAPTVQLEVGTLQRVPISSSDRDVPVLTSVVRSEPTASVPYPSVFSVAVAADTGARKGDATKVTVVFSGIDVGKDWTGDAIELAVEMAEMI